MPTDWTPGLELTAARLRERAEPPTRPAPGGGLAGSGGALYRGARRPILARLAGSGGPYTFTRLVDVDDDFAAGPNPRTGRAWEVNAVAGLAGKVVRAFPDRFGDYRFQWYAVAGTPTVGPPQSCSNNPGCTWPAEAQFCIKYRIRRRTDPITGAPSPYWDEFTVPVKGNGLRYSSDPQTATADYGNGTGVVSAGERYVVYWSCPGRGLGGLNSIGYRKLDSAGQLTGLAREEDATNYGCPAWRTTNYAEGSNNVFQARMDLCNSGPATTGATTNASPGMTTNAVAAGPDDEATASDDEAPDEATPQARSRAAGPDQRTVLAAVNACPELGPSLPISQQPECGCAELYECRAGRGETPGRVTMGDCRDCRTVALTIPNPVD